MNEILDSLAFTAFCCINSPDSDTVNRFTNLLIRNNLQKKIFDEVVKQLIELWVLCEKLVMQVQYGRISKKLMFKAALTPTVLLDILFFPKK